MTKMYRKDTFYSICRGEKFDLERKRTITIINGPQLAKILKIDSLHVPTMKYKGYKQLVYLFPITLKIMIFVKV